MAGLARLRALGLTDKTWFNALWFQSTWFLCVLGREPLLPLTLAMFYMILATLGDIVRVKNRFLAPTAHGYRASPPNLTSGGAQLAL